MGGVHLELDAVHHVVGDVVAKRDEEGVEAVSTLTGGDGTHAVIECVDTEQSLVTAFGAVRNGGVISRLGVSQCTQ